MEYWVGAWRLLAGSMHEFDPELIRKMARADLARTPNPLTVFITRGLGMLLVGSIGWMRSVSLLSLFMEQTISCCPMSMLRR